MGFSDTKIQELGVRLTSKLKEKSREYFNKASKLNREEVPNEDELKRMRAMHMTIALGLTEVANIIEAETKE